MISMTNSKEGLKERFQTYFFSGCDQKNSVANLFFKKLLFKSL